MKINLRVTYTNGEVKDVTATARDLVAFEDHFTRSISKLETDFRITDLLWLAWHWLNRTGSTNKTFDDWCDDIEAIDAGDDDPK